ncbi:MAG TPA: viral replication protein [Sedimentibacter sp.]|nr:viral replication protein [Sedimentibacter sp.]
MGNNTQSRKWTLVINNPQECGLRHEAIIEILKLFSPEYFCMADEIASTGTFHTHIFIYSKSPIRFSTIKNRFPAAHIEKAYGSAKENREYITKSGKWSNNAKSDTSVCDSFIEYGDLPTEREESNPKMYKLIQQVRDGMKIADIIDESPDLGFKVKDIDILRQTLLSDRYAQMIRSIETTYVYGATGTGKTSGIYKKHDAREICRITNYRQGKASFDSYSGQDVLVFEEFYSQFPIEEMLSYLDIYPLMLPARYSDKVACYTKVYITSNVSLSQQYKHIQVNQPETWRAFLRRINRIVEYCSDGTINESDMKGVRHYE